MSTCHPSAIQPRPMRGTWTHCSRESSSHSCAAERLARVTWVLAMSAPRWRNPKAALKYAGLVVSTTFTECSYPRSFAAIAEHGRGTAHVVSDCQRSAGGPLTSH